MLVFFDPPGQKANLLPFTYLRPIAELRLGILTIAEKWSRQLPGPYGYLTDPYLQARFPCPAAASYLYLNASLMPEPSLLGAIQSLGPSEALVWQGELLAYRADRRFNSLGELLDASQGGPTTVNHTDEPWQLRYPWDLFSYNQRAIAADFDWVAKSCQRGKISDRHTAIYGNDNLLVAEGVQVKAAIIDAEDGPIYLGKGVKLMPGAMLRGSHAICEGSQINMGAKLRGDSTIGPYCKVGGEVGNSVFLGNANKSHEGYLGNAVIGEWCNLGADTNASNLKNNYGSVKAWNYPQQQYIDTGLQFCGLFMGDHSKCGINTMFNTATVVGLSANIFGAGFPPKFVPSFAWGGSEGFATADLGKMKDLALKVMQRRGQTFSREDAELFDFVFKASRPHRAEFA